ncbi:hypothetical protein [Winogradskyella forsetii]|uniref:hypothetical protein n=1 Tax=Winogradskyella forsetii TaxID=2686077 RepID=UPI0015C76FAA|nr:hypothetical protein [Winogradskyella forsetii]
METEIKITENYQGLLPEAIQRLANLKGYASWWPYEHKLLSNNRLITAIPELCSHIVIEKLKNLHQNIVAFKFQKGFFRGTFQWILLPNDTREGQFTCTHYANVIGVTAGTCEMTTLYPFQEIYTDYVQQILSAAGFETAFRTQSSPAKWAKYLVIPSSLNTSQINSAV